MAFLARRFFGEAMAMWFVTELCGFIAAGATIAAFGRMNARPMRYWAITANVFFILYGSLGGLAPPLLLHAVLLPLNLRMLFLINHPPSGGSSLQRCGVFALWRRPDHEAMPCGANGATPTARSSTPSTTRL